MQLTLFDLWEYTEEERNQALSGKKKKSAAKSKDKNGKKQAQVTPKVTGEPAAAPAVSPQKETEGEKTEDAEAKETAVQAHPDDIYADIDWEENPPINGFYETMMHPSGRHICGYRLGGKPAHQRFLRNHDAPYPRSAYSTQA